MILIPLFAGNPLFGGRFEIRLSTLDLTLLGARFPIKTVAILHKNRDFEEKTSNNHKERSK